MEVWVLTYADDTETYQVEGVFSTLEAAKTGAADTYRNIEEFSGWGDGDKWAATVGHNSWVNITHCQVQSGGKP